MWLTWRQFRTQAWAGLGVVAAAALLFGLTGGHLTHLYDTSGLARCRGAEACAAAKSTFFSALKSGGGYLVLYFTGVVLLYLTPAALGLFWGAPLVAREVEAGTFRLVWNQSVTRTRWLAVKLGLLATAAVLVAGLLSLAVTWWAAPIDHAAAVPGEGHGPGEALPNHFMPVIFGARGLVPVACALFAFVLGVGAGLLVRRLLPAMALTAVVLVAVQAVLPMALRAHYLTPRQTSVALRLSVDSPVDMRYSGSSLSLTTPVDIPGAWVTEVRTVSVSGEPFRICDSRTATTQQCFDAINRLHLSQTVRYQPADRYWSLQWYETAVYLAAASAVTALCLRRLHRLRLD